MDRIALEFVAIVPGRQDVRSFGFIVVDATEPEDWVLPPDELVKKNEGMWQSIVSPGGETIEVAVYFDSDKGGFSMFIRQDGESIAQLQCESLPSMTFRTLGGDLIGMQAFSREQVAARP